MIDSWLEVAYCTSHGVSSQVGGFVGELGWWREWKSTACKWKNGNGKFENEANLNRKWRERWSIGKMDTSVLARKYEK